jgi:hypothetical protein
VARSASARRAARPPERARRAAACAPPRSAPAGVPSATCSRSRSPAEMCTKPYCGGAGAGGMRGACVRGAARGGAGRPPKGCARRGARPLPRARISACGARGGPRGRNALLPRPRRALHGPARGARRRMCPHAVTPPAVPPCPRSWRTACPCPPRARRRSSRAAAACRWPSRPVTAGARGRGGAGVGRRRGGEGCARAHRWAARRPGAGGARARRRRMRGAP